MKDLVTRHAPEELTVLGVNAYDDEATFRRERERHGVRLTLGCTQAWDSQDVELGKQGEFEFTGLPAERYEISIRVREYRLSHDNYSLDVYNRNSLEGWIRESKNSLLVLLEPGAPDYTHRPGRDALGEFIRRRDEALRGAEAE